MGYDSITYTNDSKNADDIFPLQRNLEKEIETLKVRILQLEFKLESFEKIVKAYDELNKPKSGFGFR